MVSSMNVGSWRKVYAESGIIEADAAGHVTEARDIDDTGAFPSSLDLWHEEVC